MEWKVWAVLFGGFIFGYEVLHLRIGSTQNAIFGLIVCTITIFLALKAYGSRKRKDEPVIYALSPLVVASIGALFFFLSLIGIVR